MKDKTEYLAIDAIIPLLQEQIDLRYDLIKTMVGTLYPSIVEDEALKISKAISVLKGSNGGQK